MLVKGAPGDVGSQHIISHEKLLILFVQNIPTSAPQGINALKPEQSMSPMADDIFKFFC